MTSTFSLIDKYRTRIFELLDSVRVPGKYKYLVLDDFSSKLIFNAVSEQEILQRNVSAIEYIEKPRRTHGSFEAIYVLSPKRYILECFISDYNRDIPRYAAANLFFTSSLARIDLEDLLASKAAQYFQRPVYFPMDFFPKQALVYSFDQRDAMTIYYSPYCHDLVEPTIQLNAQKLVSLCATLGEYPIIRFHKPSNTSYEAHPLAFLVARKFQVEIDQYARMNSNFPSTEANRPQSIFLILDRTIDMKTPLIHDLTYEAIAHDILTIENERYTYQKPDDPQEKTVGLLSDKDRFWVSLRHAYIANAMDQIGMLTRQLIEDNPDVVNIGTATSTSQLKQALFTMHGFSEDKERLELHVNMIDSISALFNSMGLHRVTELEQILATGITAEGTIPKGVLNSLVPMLDDPAVSTRDRARLVALYLIYRDGVIHADFEKLCTHSRLATPEINSIRNMQYLGQSILKNSLSDRRKSKKPSIPKQSEMTQSDQITRYDSSLQRILEDLATQSLDPELFPYTKDQPAALASEDSTSVYAQPTSTSRRNKATWVDSHGGRGASVAPRQRIFVFVTGGVTYSELKIAYDLSERFQKEIIIGAEDFLTPTEFVGQLNNLTAPREKMQLEADKPQPKVPGYLLEPDPPQAAPGQPSNKTPQKTLQPTTSAPAQVVPAAAPHKLSRNTGHHHKNAGNPPGHFDAVTKKKSKFRLFG
ncbi:Sec1-like protein [Lipomyces oligophaga]|uniref:Sec1-like protein n=1 Tax=Lipomyces oligophaga TaxID=45792 RepID=UPI0034CEB6F1